MKGHYWGTQNGLEERVLDLRSSLGCAPLLEATARSTSPSSAASGYSVEGGGKSSSQRPPDSDAQWPWQKMASEIFGWFRHIAQDPTPPNWSEWSPHPGRSQKSGRLAKGKGKKGNPSQKKENRPPPSPKKTHLAPRKKAFLLGLASPLLWEPVTNLGCIVATLGMCKMEACGFPFRCPSILTILANDSKQFVLLTSDLLQLVCVGNLAIYSMSLGKEMLY